MGHPAACDGLGASAPGGRIRRSGTRPRQSRRRPRGSSCSRWCCSRDGWQRMRAAAGGACCSHDRQRSWSQIGSSWSVVSRYFLARRWRDVPRAAALTTPLGTAGLEAGAVMESWRRAGSVRFEALDRGRRHGRVVHLLSQVNTCSVNVTIVCHRPNAAISRTAGLPRSAPRRSAPASSGRCQVRGAIPGSSEVVVPRSPRSSRRGR
jgi:hypothetical protein